jgi:hypothetical protein
LHYINNSIRKFAAEIKTYGNPVIQALPIFLKENRKFLQAKNNLPSPISVIITGNRRLQKRLSMPIHPQEELRIKK